MVKELGMIGAAFAVFLLAMVPAAGAASMDYQFDGVIQAPPGPEIINGYQANLTLTIVTADSKPFNLTNIAGANSVNVTVEFRDALGLTVDVTGDGVADTFTAVENASKPGVYETSFNTSAQPGEYEIYISAVAKNTTTGSTIEEGNATVDAYIADPYWVSTWAEEGEKVSVMDYEIGLETVNDLGAVLKLGDSLKTLSPDSNIGVVSTQIDIDGDGSATDWLFVEKTEDGNVEVKIYSKNNIIPETPESTVKVSGDTVTRTDWLKNRKDYRQIVLWDQSPMAFFKAVDYYIIPAKGGEHWSEYWGRNYRGDITVIKRTTYLSLFSTDEKIFEGNILAKTFKDASDQLTLIGVRASNWFSQWTGNAWEMVQGVVKMSYPASYELKYRDAAVPAELGLRGTMTLPGLGSGESSGLDSVNWDALLVAPEE